jgi:hypothetical protein
MLPPLAEVLASYTFLKRRFRWRWALDPAGVEEALREAAACAGDRVEDEPAALLYALLRRPMDLGDAHPELAFLLARSHARSALGAALPLDAHDPELRALRMRLVARDPARRATYDDVCAFVAERLRPLEEPPR